MTNNVPNWQKEFGIDERKPPNFFSGKKDLSASITQAHVLRKAFDLLELDGILCTENSPIVYFKQIGELTPDKIHQLHSQFWNHGGAPILVLVSKEQVHVYSSMSRPELIHEAQENPPSLVKILDRVSEGLREFLTSVESGEFFQEHARSFNPSQRVDWVLLNNLKDTREELDKITQAKIAPHALDALLCRLVFACYLFDRKVIGPNYLDALGFKNTSHLRDILAMLPAKNAKASLYKLFHQLGKDFNGDLFSDDLEAEAKLITDTQIQILSDFFHGTLVRSGQKSFWPYDFGIIPIETISAIYEHFLKVADQQAGAFYTPRFLAEVVLDTALDEFGTLLGKKFLDPACGSGIFLVGLFNRIAEVWKQENPKAPNDHRAKELKRILQESLFGVDINPTACRITAFSLYLAYLDQLTSRDIQDLQAKGHKLPYLVAESRPRKTKATTGNIYCADFFAKEKNIPADIDLIIGNPPWGSVAADKTPAGQWCIEHQKPFPDNQISTAFVWKAKEHIATDGQICFILPHGTLFNHNTTAIAFQKEWLRQHTIKRVLNLADFRWFLFDKAVHPAIVVSYAGKKSADTHHQIEYWAPKADWTIIQAEIITVSTTDRSEIQIDELLKDLDSPDAPQIWKQRFWGTPRDLRLLDKLSLYPRLREHVRGSRETNSKKPWIMAEGFQPVGKNDNPEKAKTVKAPSKNFIHATSNNIDLFLLSSDCETLKSTSIKVRSRSNKAIEIFKAPHVLITKGFQRIAFCDFDVSFRHALRGIHGPKEHYELLMFLAAYLRSGLAKYFMFHTSSSWGMYRPEGHVQEILRIPMPFPEQQPNKRRCQEIIRKVAHILGNAKEQAENSFINRKNAIENATTKIEPLIYEYFGIHPLEKLLIEDTINIVIPSIQPNKKRMPVPAVKHCTPNQREAYMKRVCEMLNMWAKNGNYIVRGKTFASNNLGIGMTVLEKIRRAEANSSMSSVEENVLKSIDHLRKIISQQHKMIDPIRGLMVFDQNRLYIAKPIAQRHWTQTSALNDADEIAGTLLMHSCKERE